jgi:hypothetical protein
LLPVGSGHSQNAVSWILRKHIGEEGYPHPLSLGALPNCPDPSLPLPIWLLQIATQTWLSSMQYVSALESGLACTPSGTRIAINVSHTMWVALQNLQDDPAGEKGTKFPVFKQSSCPCMPLAPVFPEGETFKHCTFTELASTPDTCNCPPHLAPPGEAGPLVEEPDSSADSASGCWSLSTQLA